MYKKMIWAFALLLAMQGSAFAALTGVSIVTVTVDPNSIAFSFTPANNVIIDYNTLTANPKVDYTTAAKNTNGNRVYSTSNNTTSIWFQESDDWKGVALTGTLTGITAYMTSVGQSTYTGWTGL